MLETYLLPFSIRLTDAILSGIHNTIFLTPKYNKRLSGIIWSTILFFIGIFILEPYTQNGFAGILTFITITFLMQTIFFQKDFAKQLFVTLTFVAGKYTIQCITSILFVYIGNIREIITDYFLANEYIKTIEQVQYLNKIANLIHYGIGAFFYLCIFSIFLIVISKKYICQNYLLNVRESSYLVLPCVTTLCIFITLQKLIITVEKGRINLIFDSIPETKIWVATISFLLLGTIVATDILFQYFIQYNEENQKRVFLENQVIQTKKEVTEIENIYSDMRGLRHDMQSHINSILLYVRNNKVENSIEIENYIGKMEDTISRLDFSYHCGNPIIDIIIHQAQQRAKVEGIEFFVDFVYPAIPQNSLPKTSLRGFERAVAIQNFRGQGVGYRDKGNCFSIANESQTQNHHCEQHLNSAANKKISPLLKGNGCDSNQGDFQESNKKISLSANADIPLYESGSKENITNSNDKKSINSPIDVYDMAVILNNALENAFTACQNIKNEKSINLHSYLKGNLFFIEVENTFSGQLTFNETTGLPESQKPDKKLHGIGLSNIQKCAKKYLGDLDIEISCNNGVQQFNLTVMMKV